jgi:serine/threonine-protein kinase
VASTIPPQPDTLGFSAGYRISGYRLEQQIGRGGMAVVFGAFDERLERQVALKILSPVVAEDEAFRQRFIAESRAAAAVEDPHIIPVYEAGEADGVLFIAMRLVPGGDLRTLVAEHGPLAPARAEWILSAVASALDAAHASGLVHRDVKPANMLLDVRPGRPDHVYLTDFGVSKAVMTSTTLTGNGEFIGTVDYAAPEQILGQPVDGKTDQYALGCAAFELLCGHPPYPGKQLPAAMYSHLAAPAPTATSQRPDLPAAVDSVFARVLAKSPADRYESCQEFARALRVALGLTPPGGTGDATADPASVNSSAASAADPDGASTDPRATSHLTRGGNAAARANRSRRALMSGAAAAILLAGAGAAFLLARPHAQPSVVRYDFGTQSYRGGLSIKQSWSLGGPGGSLLRVSMKVSNSSGKKVTAQLVEPIPRQVAPDRQSVTFSAKPLVTSPLVVWDLHVPAQSYDKVGYQVHEPPSGVSRQRLMTYVQAYVSVSPRQELELIANLASVWIRPHELRLTAGHAARLTAHGRLHDRRLAPAADLRGALWTTSNPAVVKVSRAGWVTAMLPGRAVVWVRIGLIRAKATVVVRGAGGAVPPPANHSHPPVQPGTSPSPTTSGSLSPTPSPSPSGSPSPTSPPPVTGSPTPT